MQKKVIIVFVEGATEKEFYNAVITFLRTKKNDKLNCDIEIINLKGIGNFKPDKVSNIFKNRIKKRYPNHKYSVFLCYDTDVFELSKKPPIDWNKVKKVLNNNGTDEVHLISAKQSIEDWFLYDTEGLRTYLNLPEKLKINGYKGIKGLQSLFRNSQKVYFKGSKCNKLVETLNIESILSHICPELHILCETLGVNCTNKKCKM